MRRGLVGFVGGLWLCSSAMGQTAEPAALPSHPLALHFTTEELELPTANGRRHRLQGETEVFLAEDHALPLVEIAVALPVGSFLEPAAQAGLCSLTGALVRRGGTRLRSADDFDRRADELGARILSFAGLTRSGASLSVPSWNLDEALDLFFEALSMPAFQEDRVTSAKSNLKESMGRRNQDPLEILEREWHWLIFGNRHFSGVPVTTKTLEAIDRQALVRFHSAYWRPESMIFAVSGDFQTEPLLQALDQRLAAWPAPAAGGAAPPVTAWPPSGPDFEPMPGLSHNEANVPQAKVALGTRLSREVAWEARDRFALEVLGEILGGSGAISRIAGRLRTAEGLVYRATARVDPGELWRGDFQIFFDTESAQVARAIELSLEELQRIRTQPVHPTELEVAKQTLLARLRLSFDTAEEIAGLLAENELLRRPQDYWLQYLRGVEATTAEDVSRVARTYLLPDRLVFLVVGRWREIALGVPDGDSRLEQIVGSRVRHLPARDPWTLQPLEPGSRP